MTGEMLKQAALPLALFAVLFGMGIGLAPDDFRRVFRHPKAKLVGPACQFLMRPAIAFLLARAFRLPGELAVGPMLPAACPGGATSNVITRLAKGDTALSVTLTAISGTVCVFTIPWIVGWSAEWFTGANAAVQLPFWKTLGQLALVTILPVVCGMALRAARPESARRLERPAGISAIVFPALAIALGLLESPSIAMPAVVYSLFMFVSGGVLIALFRRPRPSCSTIKITDR